MTGRRVVAVLAATLVVAGGTQAGAASGPVAAPNAAISVAPHTVARGGTVTVTGHCGSGPGAADAYASFRAYVKAGDPGSPYEIAGHIPLVDSAAFTAQLDLPVGAPPASYVVQMACGFQDQLSASVVDAQGLTVTHDPPLVPGRRPTVTLTTPAEPGGSYQVGGSCPATHPAADRVLLQAAVFAGNPSPQLEYTRVQLGSGGHFHATVPVPKNEPLGVHRLVMFCRSGGLFLGQAAAEYTVASRSTTTMTTATLTSTSGPPAPEPPERPPTAPPAQPVAVTARFTG
ncbi:MAG: hypothetical protein JWN46_1058 [Acidimicrobiales bacterium]|nr:hypothetical protein [Acidimicrobiales bacterium]